MVRKTDITSTAGVGQAHEPLKARSPCRDSNARGNHRSYLQSERGHPTHPCERNADGLRCCPSPSMTHLRITTAENTRAAVIVFGICQARTMNGSKRRHLNKYPGMCWRVRPSAPNDKHMHSRCCKRRRSHAICGHSFRRGHMRLTMSLPCVCRAASGSAHRESSLGVLRGEMRRARLPSVYFFVQHRSAPRDPRARKRGRAKIRGRAKPRAEADGVHRRNRNCNPPSRHTPGRAPSPFLFMSSSRFIS